MEKIKGWMNEVTDEICYSYMSFIKWNCARVFLGPKSLFVWAAQLAESQRILLPMQEMWVRSLGGEDPPEQEIATHTSILAWEIPRTEDSGRLQPTGLPRVRHNWVPKHTQFVHPENKLYVKDQNLRGSVQNSTQAHALNKEPQPIWSQPRSCGEGARETMRGGPREGLTVSDLALADRTFACSEVTS